MCIKRKVTLICLILIQLANSQTIDSLTVKNVNENVNLPAQVQQRGKIYLFSRNEDVFKALETNPDHTINQSTNEKGQEEKQTNVRSMKEDIHQFPYQSKANLDSNKQMNSEKSPPIDQTILKKYQQHEQKIKKQKYEEGQEQQAMQSANIVQTKYYDQMERRPSATVINFIHQRRRRDTNENTAVTTKNEKSLVNEPVLMKSVFKEQPEVPETAVASRELKQEVRGKKYSYYYLARTLWYVPLYFLVYFTFYILFLVVRSIVKHLGELPNNYSGGIGKRSIGDSLYYGMGSMDMNSLTEITLKMIENYAEKYIRENMKK